MSLPGDSYWVEQGRLLAGPYPGDPDPERERRKLRAFGVAIADEGVPSPSLMREILDLLDADLHGGRPAYVHCRGGAGRTGTVVGCFLIERGDDPARALAEISADRSHLDPRRRAWSSPETEQQREFVLAWRPGRD